MALKPSRAYKDLSLTFGMHPITHDITVLKNEDAIKRSLINLFSYAKGEKPFAPSFGSGIPSLLFETFDYITAGFIKEECLKLINTYEPRVNVIDLTINLDVESYSYEVQIAYTLPDTSNQISTVNLSLSSQSRV